MATNFETDTDIHKVTQMNRQYEPWPAAVHRHVNGAHQSKRVENADEHAQALKHGWFKTPLDAEMSATKGKPARTVNESTTGDDAAA